MSDFLNFNNRKSKIITYTSEPKKVVDLKMEAFLINLMVLFSVRVMSGWVGWWPPSFVNQSPNS